MASTSASTRRYFPVAGSTGWSSIYTPPRAERGRKWKSCRDKSNSVNLPQAISRDDIFNVSYPTSIPIPYPPAGSPETSFTLPWPSALGVGGSASDAMDVDWPLDDDAGTNSAAMDVDEEYDYMDVDSDSDSEYECDPNFDFYSYSNNKLDVYHLGGLVRRFSYVMSPSSWSDRSFTALGMTPLPPSFVCSPWSWRC